MEGLGSVLVWFRNDLRVNDNPALSEASKFAEAMGDFTANAQLFCLVTISPYELGQVHHWGVAKADYYLRNIKLLRRALEDLGISMIVHTIPDRGWATQEDYFTHLGHDIVRLCQQYSCRALFYNEEYDGPSIDRDKAIDRACNMAGIVVHKSHDQCVVPIGKILTKTGTPYKVYSHFKRGWIAYLNEHGNNVLNMPKKRDCKVETIGIIPDFPPGYVASESPELDLEGTRRMFPAGEEAAMHSLKQFISTRSANYHKSRNYFGDLGTSRISAPLAIGSISLRQCLAAAYTKNEGSLATGHPGLVRWIEQLCWRDFYRHILVNFPHVGYGHSFNQEYEALPWRGWEGGEEGPKVEEDFKRWCEGKTGVPIVDAAMRQIRKEAWQNNRVRMIVAMYLTKDLLIHWRRGERFFMEHLIDYDYSSNNGGWQWSASTGTDAQPYFRIFNPLLQSERFDPEGHYLRKYIPELVDIKAPAIHEPHSRLPKAVFEKLNYPAPTFDHSKAKARVMTFFVGNGKKKLNSIKRTLK